MTGTRVASLLALGLATACGASSVPVRSPAELRAAEPETLLDPASFAVASLDLGALRLSPHSDDLEALLEELQGMGNDAPGLRAILERTDRAMIGVAPAATAGDEDTATPTPSDGDAAPAAGDDEDPVPTLVLVGTAPRERFVSALEQELGPGTFIVDAEADPWTVRGPKWVLFHDGDGVAAVTDLAAEEALRARWHGPGPTPLDASPALGDAAALVDFPSGILAAAVAPGSLPEAAIDRGDEDWERWGRHLTAAGARLDLADGLEVQVVGRFDDPAVASALVADVQDELARAQRNLLLDLLLGARSLLSATHASAEGDLARVDTRLPAGDTDRLIASLRSVLGYADRALEALREETTGGAVTPRTGAPIRGDLPAAEEEATEAGAP